MHTHDLAVYYPLSYPLPFWQVLGATLLITVISIIVIVMSKRLPYLFVGWLWYAITLLPVIGIIRIGTHWMHDLYTYLPSIGISFGLAWGIASLIKSEESKNNILLPSAIVFLSIISFLSSQQCGFWKNSTMLWNHDLEVTKANVLAHNHLADALFEEGKLEEAIYHYNKIILLKPDYAEAYYNRGTVYIELGHYRKAVQDYTEAIRINPDFILAYFNRGMVYSKLGRYQPAIKDYNEVIRLAPDYADAYNNRGAVYLTQGNTRMGCIDTIKACKLGLCKILKLAESNGDCH